MAKSLTPGKFAQKELKKLNELKRNLRPVSVEEIVHQFRVQYKKTRAFYRMANSVEQDTQHQFKKSWKRLYQANGQVRDTTLLIEMVRKEFGEGGLVQQLEKESKSYEKFLQFELKLVKPFKLSREKWPVFGRSRLDQYFRQLLLPIIKINQAQITDRQLHAIRKSLKDFIYNLQSLDEMNIIYPPVIAEVKITEIGNLLNLLGNYQNEVVQSNALRRLRLLPDLNSYSNSIDNYLHQLAQLQVRQHTEIIETLKHFLHLHAPGTLD